MTLLGTGEYCVELDPSVSNATTGAIVTADYQHDTTGINNGFTHVEFNGACGTNGMRVFAYSITQGTGSFTLTASAEQFFIAVP